MSLFRISLIFVIFWAIQGHAASYEIRAAAVADSIVAHTRTRDPKEKERLAAVISNQMSTYLSAVEESLRARNIRYEVMGPLSEDLKKYEIGWSFIKILPDDSSEINAFSKYKSSYGVTVVFDAIFLRFYNGKGSFRPDLKMLYLGHDNIDTGRLDAFSAHEQMHADFQLAREGLKPFNEKIPVNIRYNSKESINPSSSLQAYSKDMSFEEMITFAINIEFKASSYMNANTKDNKIFLEIAVDHEIAISENAVLAVNKALELLAKPEMISAIQDPKNVAAYTEPDSTALYLPIGESSFWIYIYLPTKLRTQKDFDALTYMRAELYRSLKLAQFNLKYFSDYRSGMDLSVTHAKQFRSAQQSFLQTQM